MAGKEQMRREKWNKESKSRNMKWLVSSVALLPVLVFHQIKDTTTRDKRKG